MLRVKYLIGLIAVYAPFTIAFVLGALAAVIRFPSNSIESEYYFPAYFAALPAVFCIYSIASFVFTRANRAIDGVVFIIFWTFAPLIVMFMLGTVVNLFDRNLNLVQFAYNYMPTGPLNAVAFRFCEIIEKPVGIAVFSQESVINQAVGISITGAWSIASSVLLFLRERKSKAENIGGVSNSALGYKVMIPLFTVCLLSSCNLIITFYGIILAVIIASAAFMLSALYKHTFKIGKIQAIILAASITVGIALSIIFELKRYGFNLDLLNFYKYYI